MLIEIEGSTLKLLGHPTPFLAQELKVESNKSSTLTLTKDLIRFFLILFPFVEIPTEFDANILLTIIISFSFF